MFANPADKPTDKPTDIHANTELYMHIMSDLVGFISLMLQQQGSYREGGYDGDEISFTPGENRSTRRKPLAHGK